MTRYYFHQRIDGELLLDPDGQVHPDSVAAWASALASARSLWATAILAGEDLSGQAIEIANEHGLVETLPMERALPPLLRERADRGCRVNKSAA